MKQEFNVEKIVKIICNECLKKLSQSILKKEKHIICNECSKKLTRFRKTE